MSGWWSGGDCVDAVKHDEKPHQQHDHNEGDV